MTNDKSAISTHSNPERLKSKNRVIRDTFTIAEKEYFLIEKCRDRLLNNKIVATKSEILRMALMALDECSDNKLIKYHKSIDRVKVGRPKHSN